MMQVKDVVNSLKALGNPERASHSQRFFKTGKGEYGAGDIFLGIRVPALRQLATQYKDIDLMDTANLLQSKYHEVRLLALFILVKKYQRRTPDIKKEIFDLYLRNLSCINNWDLVDSSAHLIIGAWLIDKEKSLLYKLAESSNLWERRIAMMATYCFIRNGQFTDTLALARILLDDREDLIHKVVGWMLRETGNRNGNVERRFLIEHYHNMPRTMLRYAIEKFPEEERQLYLKGKI